MRGKKPPKSVPSKVVGGTGPKRPQGRPTKYTEELAEEICRRLALGETLIHICRDEGMPERQTVLYWTRHDESFYAMYARARREQADFWADECLDLAAEAHDGDSSSAQRLKVDTRKWICGKIRPRFWGENGTGFDETGKGSTGDSTKRLAENLRKLAKRRAGGSSEDSGEE